MVEQNARRCLQICDRGYVLDQGQDAYTGTGRELIKDPKVIQLYLGTLARSAQTREEGDGCRGIRPPLLCVWAHPRAAPASADAHAALILGCRLRMPPPPTHGPPHRAGAGRRIARPDKKGTPPGPRTRGRSV